ncbi:G-protein coupled receptor 182-like [Latimeria chalumnae]|uniref:G-protein coupled receptor 182-like n=1 Tax=Latimeria chalumnae TaxID=7897 RepID=UPI0003C19083|nr:PREDICTED: G-protein coupled receptor 182-like [Latimeria chalumnae]|eukprot:XP_005986248.1 PREDICTED: G-protein coupled receptor 182-like [Latimeria chalumnae]
MEYESDTQFPDYSDQHNWTDFEGYFNYTFLHCDLGLDANVKRVVLFILQLIIFVMGLVENVVVIWVNWHSWRSKDPIHLYILNMAIADLGVVLTMPVWMLEVILDYTWLWGDFLCKFSHYFYFVSMYSSVFFLTCMSIDRYLCLAWAWPPWQRHQHQIRRVTCLGVWVASLIAPIPETVHMKVLPIIEPICLFLAPLEAYDTWMLAVSLVTLIIGFLIPFPFIAVFNVLTAMKIKSLNRPESQKHCALIYAYIFVFAVSWLPFHLTSLLFMLHVNHVSLNCYLIHALYFFYDVIDCIALLHCVMNPILYNFLSKSFKKKFLNAVVKYIPKDKRGEGSMSTTDHTIVIAREDTQ